MNEEQGVCCARIAAHYGVMQLNVCVEELAELQQVICKAIRMNGHGKSVRKTGAEIRAGIIEEMADVRIMLEQVRLIMNISYQEISAVMDQKIERTLRQMERK